jgi:hypothetical protein
VGAPAHQYPHPASTEVTVAFSFHWVDIPEEIRDVHNDAYHAALAATPTFDQRDADLAARGVKRFDPLVDDPGTSHPDAVAVAAERRAAWDAYLRTGGAYFQLNNAATRLACDRLGQAGAVEPTQPPSMPDPAAYGTSHDEWAAYQDAVELRQPFAATRELRAFLRDYQAAAADPCGAGVIAQHKLEGLHEWIITPAELRAALPRAPEVALDDLDQPIAWWIPWLEFLRRSAAHGGTVVR